MDVTFCQGNRSRRRRRGCCRAGLERDEELVPRPRLYERGLERGGESVPRPRPYARGLERDGESVPCPRPYARGLERDGESVPHPRPYVRGLERDGESVRGGLGGPAEPRTRWGLASSCLLASIFTGSKQFFGFCLGDPFLWYPTVAPEPWGERERSFRGFDETWLAAAPGGMVFHTRGLGGCA